MRTSRRLSTLLALGAAIAVTAAALPVTASVDATRLPAAGGMSPDSISGVMGQTSLMSVSVSVGPTGKLLGSYEVTIVWDSTVVRLDSVRSGGFGTLGAGNVNFVNGGEVKIAQVNTGGVGGTITLANLYFRFVSGTIGDRTTIVPTFSELTSTVDFANLLEGFTNFPGVARVVPPTVKVGFTPDSLFERVGFKPRIDLVSDLTQATGVALGSYVAAFTWDATVMALDSAVAGDFGGDFTQNQPVAGELRLTSANAQGPTGLVTLAKLYFRFLGDTWPRQTALTLDVSEMHAAGSFADLLPGLIADDGKVVIGGVLRGDIDLGGTVAALDAQLILQHVVGLALPAGAKAIPNGDGDCNGTLQARDAQIVLNQVVGNPVSQFCAGKIQ